jgi:replicative DNA helicase
MFHDKCLIEDDKMSLDEIEASVIHNDKDVIFIDYVQNIRANGKDEYERMSRIAQELQKMAITTKKVFFDLSQVSNE